MVINKQENCGVRKTHRKQPERRGEKGDIESNKKPTSEAKLTPKNLGEKGPNQNMFVR